LSHLIDHELDLSVFSKRYNNDETGAPAWNPAVLLKIVLFAYSRGVISSRKIAQYCDEHMIFMALSADSHPHFTTIADFISTMHDEIIVLFRNVLLICSEMKLIDGSMFAIDGCKLPSNASKEWSGTKNDLLKKKEKIEKTLRSIVKQHKTRDGKEAGGPLTDQSHAHQIKKLKAKVRKLDRWLRTNEDKQGQHGRTLKSNITDNESAKMKCSHGVVQGYNGLAVVDAKHQIVVYGEAFGSGQEYELLSPVIQGAKENLQAIGKKETALKGKTVIADTGFSCEKNLEMLDAEGINAYIPDNYYRKRDPRFVTAKHHHKERKQYGRDSFTFDPRKKEYICPAGKRLHKTQSNMAIHGRFIGNQYRAFVRDCKRCRLRKHCIRGKGIKLRTLFIATGLKTVSHMSRMIEKIDTVQGRYIYSRRMGIVEPVFGNIRGAKQLNRFTLRGKKKVNVQWLLFTMVHNIGKICRYGEQKAG
jgi:transposase